MEKQEKVLVGAHAKGEIKIIEGVKCAWKDKGYTLRQYFSHETEEKGPGPGWDFVKRLLDDEWARERFGRTFSGDEVFNPQNLPDLPYFDWEEEE